MKPTAAFFCLLACCGVLFGNQTSPRPSAAKPSPLLEELVQMTRAGSSDAEILAYARAHRGELPAEVKADDLIWLHASGVSERVVTYMSAIDVRIPDGGVQESPAPEVPGQDALPRPSYSYPESESGPYDSGYVNGDVTYSNDYAYPDSYADSYYGSYWGDWYPYSGYGYGYYPYAFFLYQPPFCNRFHDHVGHHDHHGHHGHDGDHGPRNPHSVATARNTTTEAWRSRGLTATARRPAAVGARGPSRTEFARPGAGRGPAVASRTLEPRGFGSSGPARGGYSGGFRGPQASIASRGSISRPSFSGAGQRGGSSGGMHGGGGSVGGARGRH